MPRHIAALLVLCFVPTGARGQSTLDSACAAPEHRQFDFWIGSWTVTNPDGRALGTNEIVRIAGGCGLREHWRGIGGNEGMSLNVWQPALDRWTQFWVGAGAVLYLTGGVDGDGRMVLRGERQAANGTLSDRITWTALATGAVRQEWDVSADGGNSWRKAFTGLYHRAVGGDSTGTSPPRR